ncbi:DNA polymerase III subunit delta [Coxiella endosymbiont of Amblyomma americanum]|uniref:DNA polymerase III subunit delta n=1 Tax=Coxiella endosymbiont of Amblyomma americanum TaxID=325775 RepID=UPI001E54BCD8|nr:DNA polymerase III subunit delta [Coxiella endosymbiont of Amblyomma americanum]
MHLINQPLLPIYLICSDVPLLAQEARDSIRKAAYQKGFLQRELFFIDSEYGWTALDIAVNNFDIFSEKTFIEIRNPQAKFSERGIQLLSQYVQNPPPNKKLLIITDKLTTVQKKAIWYKEISKSGVVVLFWPLSKKELQKWIEQRLKKFNMVADIESINLISAFTEGNLLAAQQTIEKLYLIFQEKPLKFADVSIVIHDNAYFTVFDLVEAALLGNQLRVTRILSNLKFVDKESAPLVLWALTRELRNIYTFFFQQSKNSKYSTQLFSSQWLLYKKPIQIARSRLNPKVVSRLLQYSKQVDWVIKGVIPGNAWQELEVLGLALAGKMLR